MAERTFKGKVNSDAITIGPKEFIPLHISRPFNRATQSFHNQEIRFADVGNIFRDEVPLKVQKDRGNRVRIQWDLDDKVYKNQLNAIQAFSFAAKNNKFTDWNNRAKAFVLGTRIDDLQPIDIFAGFRQAPVFCGKPITDFMKLNDEQKLAVSDMQHARGGFAIVQGPAGTSKSRIWEELCRVVLRARAEKPVQVLIVSAANDAGLGLVDEKEYILRVHSPGSEKALQRIEADQTRPIPEGLRPPNFPGDLIEQNLSQTLAVFLDQYRKATKTEFAGVYDPRVKLPHLSVMTTALEQAGIASGPRTVQGTDEFSSFREDYAAFAQGERVDKDEWKTGVTDLWQDTIRNAAIVVSNTAQAGMNRVLSPMTATCRLIIIDEAAHQVETGLVPSLTARFTNVKGFVQIGDVWHLNPTVLSSAQENIFSNQNKISLMTRAMSFGFPVQVLNTQYRFVKEPADLANKTTYGGRLMSTEAAEPDARSFTREFFKVARHYIGKSSSKVMIDVMPGSSNQVMTTGTNSRYNDLFVVIVANVVLDLIEACPTATVLVMTAYRAQKDRYATMLSNMAARKVPGIENVVVAVSESVQGEQFNYVIKDLLVTSQNPSLGFQADSNRLTMEMTRARDGLILVTNLSAVKKCPQAHRSSMVLRWIESFSDHVICKFRDTKIVQQNTYYRVPGESTADDGETDSLEPFMRLERHCRRTRGGSREQPRSH